VKLQRKRRDLWVALGAAYLVLVQMLVTGIALGAEATPSRQAGLPTVICSFRGSSAVPDGTGHPSGPAHLPECCTLGCSMFGPTVAPPPAMVSLPLSRQITQTPVVAFADQAPAPGERRTPGNPRAPPTV
jgi:hypothetical protein